MKQLREIIKEKIQSMNSFIMNNVYHIHSLFVIEFIEYN
jgi:hypothetical protein